jgi:hypothetical protein
MQMLYRLSYVGAPGAELPFGQTNGERVEHEGSKTRERGILGTLVHGVKRLTRDGLPRPPGGGRLERETGFEPATLSLEG